MRRGTAVLVVVTVAALLGAAGLLTWTWARASSSAAAAAGQQRAGAVAERDWTRMAAPHVDAAVPVSREPRAGGAVATIRVPRFGRSWVRVVRQGVGEDVLDDADAGVGHYPGTAMPGGVGNFAVAGHDTGWGDAFRTLGRLRVGDEIRVEDAQGVYVYAFRDFRWVAPSRTEVLLPVPERPTAPIASRLLTITTCDPPYRAEERFVAHGELVRFVPAQGRARSFEPRASSADRAAAARLAAALATIDGTGSRAAVVRAVRGEGGALEVGADRTSVGRRVPAIQVAMRRGELCVLGQVGDGGVRTTFAAPVAGRCLIGAPKVFATG